MEPCAFGKKLTIAVLVTVFNLVAPPAYPDAGGLEGFVGRWNVRLKALQPQRSEITYTETYEWVLDGKFLRGQTGRKPDGTQDVYYATYDENANGYPFWIFSSSGAYTYLAPGIWNARTRTMEWTNPSGLDISYRSLCKFPDLDTRRCTLIVKDWKGAVLSELEWSATRRRD